MSLNDILFRIKLLFLKDKELYAFCYRLLGFAPRNIGVYRLAFAHRSQSITVYGHGRGNNERLEYLGDAVLGAIVADMLYKMYPRRREGFLTNTRSKIVKRETLSKIAQKMGLDEVVHPVIKNHPHNTYVYGNALEALVGAVYIDQGYKRCMTFVIDRIIKPYIDIRSMAQTELNFKSKLLEWGQKYRVPIDFELLETTVDGSNNQVFHSLITIYGRPVGEATGYTKKESHQLASKQALRRISEDVELRDEILKKAEESVAETEEATGMA